MRALTALFLALSALLAVSPACADSVATVMLHQGPVEAGAGKLFFSELEPGGAVKVNDFSQYRGPEKEKKAAARWDQGTTPRPLTVGEALAAGEVIHTGALGWARVILKDDSLIDLGPDTDFSVHGFEMSGKERHVRLRLLSGKARILVVRKLEGRSTFYVTTPGVLVTVRGTDFAVHTDLSGDEAVTHVLGIRGQVTCDLARNIKKGEVYHQPVIVNTYSLLSVRSVEGYALSFDLEDKLSGGAYSSAMDEHAPLTDPMISPLGRHPLVSELPGTGIRRGNGAAPAQAPAAPSQNLARELEAEHPHTTIGGISPSGNFDAPQELHQDWNAVNQRLGPYTRALGTGGVDRLPYEALRAATPSLR